MPRFLERCIADPPWRAAHVTAGMMMRPSMSWSAMNLCAPPSSYVLRKAAPLPSMRASSRKPGSSTSAAWSQATSASRSTRGSAAEEPEQVHSGSDEC